MNKKMFFSLSVLIFLIFNNTNAQETLITDTLKVFTTPKIGVVNSHNVTMRKGPDKKEPIVGYISDRGTFVDVIAEKGEWYKVNVENVEAWIFNTYISFDKDDKIRAILETANNKKQKEKKQITKIDNFILFDKPKPAIINASNVNVRKIPSLNGEILATIPKKNTTITLTGKNQNWLKVQFGDISGWVFNNYVITLNDNLSSEKKSKILIKESLKKDINISEQQISKVNGKIAGKNINIRSGPSIKHKIISKIHQKGETVKIIKWQDNWYNIVYNNKNGWIFDKFVEIDTHIEQNVSEIESNIETVQKKEIIKRPIIKKGKQVKELTIQETAENEIIKDQIVFTALVTGDNVNLRDFPGAKSKKVGKVEKKGTEVIILGFDNGWFNIKIDELEAWISGKYIAIEKCNITKKEAFVLSGNINVKNRVNIRKEPKIDAKKIASFTKNESPVNVLDYKDGWFQIQRDSTIGWIFSPFIELIVSSPIIKEPVPDIDLAEKEIEKPDEKKIEMPVEKLIKPEVNPEKDNYTAGIEEYKKQNYEEAKQYFLKALEYDHDNPTYNHYIGKVLLIQKKYIDAKKYLLKAKNIEKNLPGLYYDISTMFFQLKDYNMACFYFSELADKDQSDADVQFLAGISFYKMNNFERAVVYFKRALFLNPKIKDICNFYSGICYFNIGETTIAMEKFNSLLDSKYKENAQNWIDSIKKIDKKNKAYSLYAKLGIKYDDNVLLAPDNLIGLETQNGFEDEDDVALVFEFNGKYKIINSEKYIIGMGYDHYSSIYNDLSEFNLTGSKFNLFGRYRIKDVVIGFQYMPEYYWIDSESYVMRHRFRPELGIKISNKISTALMYTYDRNNYFLKHNRDNHENDLSLNVYYKFNNKLGYLFGGFGLLANSSTDHDYSYDQIKLLGGVKINLPQEFDFCISGKYYNSIYDQVDSDYNVERDDVKYFFGFAFSKTFYENMIKLQLEYNLIDNDSNIYNYQYTRNIIGLSIMALY